MRRSGMWLENPPAAQGREWNTPRKCLWGYRAGGEGGKSHSTRNSPEPQSWREGRIRKMCLGLGHSWWILSCCRQGGSGQQNADFVWPERGDKVGISHSNCKLQTLGFSHPRKSLFSAQTGSQGEPGSAASLGASSEPHWWRHYCLYWDRATPNSCFLLIFPLFCPLDPVCVAPDQACGYHILCNVYSGACSALPLLLVAFKENTKIGKKLKKKKKK